MVSVSVQELLENPPEVFLSVSEVLVKYADDILTNPNNSEYRSILVACPDVCDKLLSVKGGVECLFSMGFEEAGEYFVYPKDKNVEYLRRIRDELENQRNIIMMQTRKQYVGSTLVDNKRYSPDIERLEALFLEKLFSNADLIMLYEDPISQDKARQCIPFEILWKNSKKRVEDALSETKTEGLSSPPPLKTEDYLLIELLDWFKNDFFKWVDKPECEKCHGDTIHVGHVAVLTEEKKWNASRVEKYQCGNSNCGGEVRFPRYNNPVKLLETRRGRCGEWANCFALICRSVGLDTRFAVDWSDHVWVEIFSKSQSRWIHADPCENICDEPLLYEIGWKKKLSYVIAFSKDEIVDVTWRYSRDHASVLSRRLQCRENWLLKMINELNFKRQDYLRPREKEILSERLAFELVEFLCPRVNDKSELPGRVSGSLDWRLSRGETKDKFTFYLSKEEIEKKRFHLKYSSNIDKYVRVSENNTELIGWASCTFESRRIMRKVEQDWKMSYLAREPGSDSALISWKFDFSNSGLSIDSIHVAYRSDTFHDGVVDWKLISDEKDIKLLSGDYCFRGGEFAGSKILTLMAELNGGDGSNAWQHSQIFRQSLSNKDEFSLEIIINLR